MCHVILSVTIIHLQCFFSIMEKAISNRIQSKNSLSSSKVSKNKVDFVIHCCFKQANHACATSWFFQNASWRGKVCVHCRS